MKELSIIIPGFNCEKTIKKCLDSILFNQDLEDIDVFFINDGSNDSTEQIVYQYMKNEHFHYFYQENLGVSSARNLGIKLSNEYKYLMFVDADDWLEKKSLKLIKTQLKLGDYDFLFTNWNNVCLKGKTITYEKQKIDKYFDKNTNIDDLVNHFIKYRRGGAPWAKVYKTEKIFKYNIFFHKDLPYAEDYIFNLEYLSHCEKIKYIPEEIYNYNCCIEGEGSKFRKNYFDLFMKIEEYKSKAKIFMELSDKQKKMDIYEKSTQLIISYRMAYDNRFNKEERQKYIDTIILYAKKQKIKLHNILYTLITINKNYS